METDLAEAAAAGATRLVTAGLSWWRPSEDGGSGDLLKTAPALIPAAASPAGRSASDV